MCDGDGTVPVPVFMSEDKVPDRLMLSEVESAAALELGWRDMSEWS